MKIIYFLSLVLLMPCALFAQKADTLITATDTLIFIKQPLVKLSKPELYVKQATEKQVKPLEAITLYKKALASKTTAQDSNWVGDIRFAIAKLHFKLNDTKQGFLELLTAQSLYSQSRNLSCQAAITKEIAGIYEKSQDWAEVEKFYLLALKQQESANLILEIPYTQYALAKGYYKLKDVEKTMLYLNSAINQFELNRERTKRSEAYMMLLGIKMEHKDYDASENLILKRALPFYNGAGLPKGKIACFDMLGQIYQIQKRYSEAKWFYIQANTLSRATSNVNGVIASLINLSEVKTSIGDFKSALKDLKEAEVLAKKRKNNALLTDLKNAYTLYNKAKSSTAIVKVSANNQAAKKIIAENKPKEIVKGGQL